MYVAGAVVSGRGQLRSAGASGQLSVAGSARESRGAGGTGKDAVLSSGVQRAGGERGLVQTGDRMGPSLQNHRARDLPLPLPRSVLSASPGPLQAGPRGDPCCPNAWTMAQGSPSAHWGRLPACTWMFCFWVERVNTFVYFSLQFIFL